MRRVLSSMILLAAAGCSGPQVSGSGNTGSAGARSPTASKPGCRGPNDPLPPLPLGEADLDEVGRKLAASILASRWHESFRAEKGRAPALRFYPVRNRSAMHLDLRRMTRPIEVALSRSGKVALVADVETAGDLRGERDRSARTQGNELGADFIFTGWLTQTSEALDDTRTVHAFTIAAEIDSVDDNRKVWVETVLLKKMIEVPPPCPEPARRTQ